MVWMFGRDAQVALESSANSQNVEILTLHKENPQGTTSKKNLKIITNRPITSALRWPQFICHLLRLHKFLIFLPEIDRDTETHFPLVSIGFRSVFSLSQTSRV